MSGPGTSGASAGSLLLGWEIQEFFMNYICGKGTCCTSPAESHSDLMVSILYSEVPMEVTDNGTSIQGDVFGAIGGV